MQQDAAHRITQLKNGVSALAETNEALSILVGALRADRAQQEIAIRALLYRQKVLLLKIYARRSEKMGSSRIRMGGHCGVSIISGF